MSSSQRSSAPTCQQLASLHNLQYTPDPHSLLRSDLQRQNTSAFIKNCQTFLLVGLLNRPIQTMTDDNCGPLWNRAPILSWGRTDRSVGFLEIFFFLWKTKKKKDLTLLYCYSEFVRAGGKKCPIRVRMKGRSLHGLLTRFGKGLCGTWPDKEIKRLTQKVPQSTALS